MLTQFARKNLALCRVVYKNKMNIFQLSERKLSTMLPYQTLHDIVSLKDKENLRSPSMSSSHIKRPIYMDYQATTPVDIRVLDAMMPFLTCMYGNPHSRTHSYGWEAEHYVEKARESVASLLNCESKEIIFTSGATESNNLAIKGLSWYFHQNKKKNHIITTQIEHKCLLASCRDIQERLNWDVTYLPVDRQGLVNLDQLREAIRPTTAFVSIICVNNEIGVHQPMEAIGEICQEHNILFHTDAAQACGKVPVDVKKCHIDLLSLSGHKIYGPKGVGALYIQSKKPRIRLTPIISGGGQEKGLRSGTLPTPLIVGLGAACGLAEEEMSRDLRHISSLYEKLYQGLFSKVEKLQLNGSQSQRTKTNLNISFEAVEGESLIMSLEDIALSSGSACTSASLEPSYVLRAIGVDEEVAHTSLRFGLGRFTTEEEINLCINAIVKSVKKLRDMSPLWNIDSMSQQKPVWT
ncbi:cysteine desulfurase IscS-like [Hylaeus volcanicus]|uniref:cysteine desulfurase IscS-like n=1 Tax=Hylaeus volcanicus TaxID=313075 RepID=UPI0023B83B64|nr:cysteine desulfurase IscS-like [Hylaeus volcanicus]